MSKDIRYKVKIEKILIESLNLQLEKYILIDDFEQVYVEIIPALGSNIIGFYQLKENHRIDFIYPPGDLEDILTQKVQFYGNPILFPFPNRIPSGHFDFGGKIYYIKPNFSDGTAIHGLVFDKPWDVINYSEKNDENSFLITSLYSKTIPEILSQFPFPFEIQVTFRLQKNVLHLSTKVTNFGENILPIGFGIHPYFAAGSNMSERGECILKVPAKKYWELINCLPTGTRKSVSDEYNLQKGKKLKNLYFDDIFTNLLFDKNGWNSCELINPIQGYKLTVQSDQNFQHVVIYAPKEHNFICIEPYTCVTNAINIAKKEIIELSPNNSINFEIKIIIENNIEE